MKQETCMPVGVSTGCLYRRDIYSKGSQQSRFLEESGASAIEICLLGDWETSRKRIQDLGGRGVFSSFAYRSVHLPDVDESLTSKDIDEVKRLVDCHKIATVLTHPLRTSEGYPVEAYRRMIAAGIPLAIENMNSQKNSGHTLEDLRQLLVDVDDLHFVLDVQHAYEHDPKMEYAKELFEMTRDQLAEIHISGETEGVSHCLIHRATNAEAIMAFLAEVTSQEYASLIIEGDYSNPGELVKEIDFVIQGLNL